MTTIFIIYVPLTLMRNVDSQHRYKNISANCMSMSMRELWVEAVKYDLLNKIDTKYLLTHTLFLEDNLCLSASDPTANISVIFIACVLGFYHNDHQTSSVNFSINSHNGSFETCKLRSF